MATCDRCKDDLSELDYVLCDEYKEKDYLDDIKQARLEALQECREIAAKQAAKEKDIVESEAVKNSAMFGDNGANKERRKSTMDYHGGKHDGLLYLSQRIQSLIDKEGRE